MTTNDGADDGRLAFTRQGSGPPVVFLHGLGASQAQSQATLADVSGIHHAGAQRRLVRVRMHQSVSNIGPSISYVDHVDGALDAPGTLERSWWRIVGLRKFSRQKGCCWGPILLETLPDSAKAGEF